MPTPTTELRQRREALGLTRQQVAQSARCSVAMLQLLESGYRPERSPVLARVDAALSAHGDASDHNPAPADDTHRQAA